MDNHYHLIMETPEGNLSKVMQVLQTSYTVYFNRRYKRSGHLFQGRYKAQVVQEDSYLHMLSRYIHLNPVRANLVQKAEEYTWSSYGYYTTGRSAPRWMEVAFILGLFDCQLEKAKERYKNFVKEFQEIGQREEIYKIKGTILGDEAFQIEISNKYLHEKNNEEIPEFREINRSKIKIEDIEFEVDKKVKDVRLARGLKIYLIRKYTALRLKEVGNDPK